MDLTKIRTVAEVVFKELQNIELIIDNQMIHLLQKKGQLSLRTYYLISVPAEGGRRSAPLMLLIPQNF